MSNYYNRQWRLPNAWNGTESNVNKSNYSMDFNNVLGIETSLDVNEFSQITFSFWFKTSAQQNSKYIISMPDGAAANGVEATFTNTSVRYRLTGQTTDTSIDATFTYYDDNWHHIVCTYDGSTQKIYVDGALSNSGTANNGTLKTRYNKLYIGSFNWVYGLGPDVTLDGVSIFNYALSSSQVTTLYGSSSTGIGNPMSLSPAPVAYYPLGDQDAFNGSNYLVPNSSLKDYVFNQNGNQLVTITGNSTTQPTGDYSLSIWVKIVGSATYSGILNATTNNNANGVGFLYKYSTGQFEFYQGAFANILIFTGSTNTWQNIIISYNNTTGDLIAYLNGQQADSNTITPSGVSWVVDWQLNNYRQSASPLYGQNEFSNFQIFDTALSASDAETLYNNGSPLTSMSGFTSLQGWWKLDASATYDSSTTTWTIPDDSTNSNDGTSSGMTQANLVQSDLSFTSGYSPYALAFDGTNDYISISPSVATSNQHTVSTWIKSNDLTSSAIGYLFTTETTIKGIGLDEGDGSFGAGKFYYWNGGSATTVSTTAITVNNWHHIVFVFDSTANEIKFYLDGNLDKTTTVTIGTAGSIKTIGSYNAILHYLNGLLSNFSIWNAALTSSQVTEIYNQGVPSNLNNHSAYSNLVSWWQLGSNSSFNTNWTVLDEKGTNNGTSANMGEDAIVDGVGSYANGTSSGMGGDEVIGDAPYSTANSLSVNMDIEDRVSDTPS